MKVKLIMYRRLRWGEIECTVTAISAHTTQACVLLHLRPVATDVSIVFRLVPMDPTATTITIEMPPAMMAYSMAVAAVSSFRKRNSVIVSPFLALAGSIQRLTTFEICGRTRSSADCSFQPNVCALG